MPFTTRLLLFVYNLIMLALAVTAVAISLGWSAPVQFMQMASSTPENRIILGTVGLIAGILIIMLMISGLKGSGSIKTITVEKSDSGEVSMSVSAIKSIIAKAAKQVTGTKEVRSEVSQSANGLTVKLHTMVVPDHNVPGIAAALQTIVKEQLEKVGGLKVAEVKVLVDDFNPESK